LAAGGRQPDAVRRSLMTGCYFGRDEAEVKRKTEARSRSAAEMRAQGILVGSPSEIVDQLGELAAAGVQRVMLQWLEQDDIAGLEEVAKQVLSRLANGGTDEGY